MIDNASDDYWYDDIVIELVRMGYYRSDAIKMCELNADRIGGMRMDAFPEDVAAMLDRAGQYG